MATNGTARKPAPESKPEGKRPLPPSMRNKKTTSGRILSSPSVLLSAAVGLLSAGGYFTQELWVSHAVLALDRVGLSGVLPQDLVMDARTTEVAGYMADIYNTLADMKYIDPVGIEYGPHDILIGPRIADKISPEIQQLWSKMPYVDKTEAGQADLIYGSQFVDFRTSDDVVRSSRTR